MHESRVFFAILVVIKRDDIIETESGGKIGYSRNTDADMRLTKSFALVIAVLLQQFLNLHARE
jgi:hypothetical protein